MKLKKYNKLTIATILCIFILIICYLERKLFLSILLSILYLILLNIKFMEFLKKEEFNREKSKQIALQIENSIKNSALDIIHPVVVINSDERIIWFNNAFKNLYPSQSIKNNKLIAVVRGLDIDNISKCKKGCSEIIEIDKTMYEVYGNKVIDDNNEELMIVNFTDITYSKETIKQGVMIIEVDNLKLVEADLEEDKRPLLIPEIQRTINNYAISLGAMVQKYDYNKYILSVLNSEIDNEVSKKFNILDLVREINVGNNSGLTLSIGVGIEGNSPQENQKYASKALELALGRGGDQVVIKSKDRTEIFGGNTPELEKRTRVRARVVAHAIRNLIYESNHIYIMGHKNPDMDCFGAAFGLASAVKQLGKECNIVLENDTKSIDFFLKDVRSKKEYRDLIVSSKEVIKKIDNKSLLIITDVHNTGYVSNIDLLKSCDRVVIIDHHRKSTDYIKNTLLTYNEIYASSTSELVTELIQYMIEKPKLKVLEAEALLAGICMDTKNFTFKTGVRTFEAAAVLRKLGADTVEVKKLFSNDLKSYIAKADVIRSAEVKDGIAIAVCPPNISEIAFAAQGADELLNIIGIECSFVFVKIDNVVYLSSRSLGEVNVQIIMEALGGGGHRTMAGAQFANISIEEAKSRLKETLNKYLEKGDK